MKEVESVNQHVRQALRTSGVEIVHTYVCPHNRADNCVCIKPEPHFLERAAGNYALDLSSSFVIGDHPHDVELARNAGALGIYVLTGHGAKHQAELADDVVVVPDMKEAVEWICAVNATGISLNPQAPRRNQESSGR